jgi:hypothetical protein
MTLKEKAQELFDKMILEFPLQENTNANVSYIAKQCAFIAVDEIMKITSESYDIDHELLGIQILYWEKVKQEIEKL